MSQHVGEEEARRVLPLYGLGTEYKGVTYTPFSILYRPPFGRTLLKLPFLKVVHRTPEDGTCPSALGRGTILEGLHPCVINQTLIH